MNTWIQFFRYPLMIIGLILLNACSGHPYASTTDMPPDSTIQVAVSIVPQQTWVEKVGGDAVSVVTMIPPGYSPETYAPGPQRLKDFSDAALYFTIGVPSEATSILPGARELNPELRIVDLAAAAEAIYPPLELEPGEKDPHVWMSPRRVIPMIDSIADELAALDPSRETLYRDNAAMYKEELLTLDAELSRQVAECGQRSFIIFHPSMGYFAADYGLTMIAIEEHGKKATPQNLQRVIDSAREQNLKVIFYQEEHDSHQAQSIADEIGGITKGIAPLAADYVPNLYRILAVFQEVLASS